MVHFNKIFTEQANKLSSSENDTLNFFPVDIDIGVK